MRLPDPASHLAASHARVAESGDLRRRDLARLAVRHPRVVVHPRAPRRRRRLGAHAPGGASTRRTSIPISRAAASTAACSTPRIDALGARAAAVGVRPHDGDRAREAARARGDRPVARTTWRDIRWRNAARIFPRGSLPALCARVAAPHDRLRRVHRSVSVSRSFRIPIRTCSCACSTREGLSGAWVGYLPSPWQRDPAPRQRRALRRARAASSDAACRARRSPGLAAMGAHAARRRRAGRAGHSRVSDALGHGPARSVDARAGARVRRDRRCRSCSPCGSRTCASARSLDVAGDLTAAHVRALARAGDAVRLVVTGAGPRAARGGALGPDPGRAAARVLGLRVDLGSAGGSPRAPVPHRRRASASSTARTGRCG